jgi:hypothetical protein
VTSQACVLAKGVLDSHRSLILRAAEDCPEAAIVVVQTEETNQGRPSDKKS